MILMFRKIKERAKERQRRKSDCCKAGLDDLEFDDAHHEKQRRQSDASPLIEEDQLEVRYCGHGVVLLRRNNNVLEHRSMSEATDL